MKLLSPTGYAKLRTAAEALKYARARLAEGCQTTIKRDGEYFRVSFEPQANT
jgi:hypothetical protein